MRLFHNFIRKIICILSILIIFGQLKAGPPFYTDDPEPVDLHHWEYYISSLSMFRPYYSTGTLPHAEINYGIAENTQVHLLLPVNYQNSFPGSFVSGYANTEIGVKYRLLKETTYIPQMGMFPLAEVPTLHNTTFGNGKVQLYIPFWLQKSIGKFTSYGGAGCWFNPGKGNKNWVFYGWEAQYDLSKVFTLGAEIFHETPDNNIDNATTIINAGGFINFSENWHFLYSAGRSLSRVPIVSLYVGLQLTI